MTLPRLRQRVSDAAFDPEVARTIVAALEEIVSDEAEARATKQALIARVMGGPLDPGPRAPFEALWPHADLFLTVCIYVAVTDGHYGVEEARHISGFAHRLGLSARQLERLEARVFEELKLRATASTTPALVTDERTESGGPAHAVRGPDNLAG